MEATEFFITGVKAFWKGELVECALIVKETEVIFGKEIPLKARATRSERVELDAEGALMMPLLQDQLSFLPVNSHESDLQRLRETLYSGGIEGGLLVPEDTTSRVKWLDLGRRIRKVFGLAWRFGGPEAHIRRWAQLGRELPPLVVVESVQALQSKGEQLRLCEAQDHRGIEHRHMFTPFTYSKSMLPLILEEQRSNETINETIQRLYSEVEEIEAAGKAEEVKNPLLGTTIAHGYDKAYPFLGSLLLDQKSNIQKANLIPLRSPKMRFQLLQSFRRQSRIDICVGNGMEDQEELDLGHPLASMALPLLIDQLKPFLSWVAIWKKLGGKETLNAFALLKKSTLQDKRKIDLPFGLPLPKFHVSHTFRNGTLIYERS
ncbi:MAG: hypothetical protein D6732_14305 [Methanobacteriota archaeon]|nr:MAG: hypothetical protein D6732_14305 [Euryarchaeota archaeon]